MEQQIEMTKMVTIHIDESMHASMKHLARIKKVLISNLYEQAVESFLDAQNNTKNSVKNKQK
jgi:predicted transcriptional regulator